MNKRHSTRPLTRLAIIKNQKIFSIINEVSYVLSLSNEPQQLVEMVLDKLLHLLKVDYGWVQLVGLEDRTLRLMASRGSTPEMSQVAGLNDSQQILGERVLVGLKEVIPDLSRDGQHGLSSFGLVGLRSLVAVPIRTYHTQGVIGVASRTKKRLDNEAAELLMTVAGMVGATLNVAELGRMALDRERQRIIEEMLEREAVIVEDISESVLTTAPESPVAQGSSTEGPHDVGMKEVKSREDNPGDEGNFGDHSRRMASFREAHGEG